MRNQDDCKRPAHTKNAANVGLTRDLIPKTIFRNNKPGADPRDGVQRNGAGKSGAPVQ